MVDILTCPASENNLPDFTPFEIEQTSYDVSSVQYEEATDRKLKVKGDTVILGGYGASIRIEHKALVLSYGRMSEEDKTLRLFKGTNKVRQIILVSDGGYVSIEAIKFCIQENIHVLMLDWRGSLIQVLTPKHPSNAKLICKQYLASQGDLGLSISVELIRQKTLSQIATLEKYPHLPKQAYAIDALEHGLQELHTVSSLEKLRTVEGTMASAYLGS